MFIDAIIDAVLGFEPQTCTYQLHVVGEAL